MTYELNKLDNECLKIAIDIAKEAYKSGNFPVGAVLVIDNQIIDKTGSNQESWVTHAENILIIKNAKSIQEARKSNKEVKIFTSLEPCIQCLGASVSNRINQIFYVQKDPIGGACSLKPDSIGLWYKENWPEIYNFQISDEPKKLLIEFFRKNMEIDSGKWSKKCYDIYSNL